MSLSRPSAMTRKDHGLTVEATNYLECLREALHEFWGSPFNDVWPEKDAREEGDALHHPEEEVTEESLRLAARAILHLAQLARYVSNSRGWWQLHGAAGWGSLERHVTALHGALVNAAAYERV